MTALSNRQYSGHSRATEMEGNQRTRGKQTWRKKCGQQVSGSLQLEEDGGGSTWQSWMETSSMWHLFYLE